MKNWPSFSKEYPSVIFHFSRALGLLLLLCVWVTPAAAMLNIEITQALDAPRPIAVIPFSVGDGVSVDVMQTLTKIMNDDLRYSGLFKPLAVTEIHRYPHTPTTVSLPYWREQDVEAIVVGSIAKITDTTFKVDYALVDVIKRPHENNRLVLDTDAFIVSLKELRHLGHHLSDRIYYHLTGVKGAFSTRIAYVVLREVNGEKQYALEIADADGFNPQPVVVSNAPIMSPAWSPDGHSIAYVSFAKGHSEIDIINILQGNMPEVVSEAPGINGAPAWSPDGTKLAMVLSKQKIPNLYLYDLRQKRLQQLTQGWSIDTEPSFSPDGQRLVFTSNRGGRAQIYELDLGTNKINRLTYDGAYNARARYTPDGQHIVVVHEEDGKYRIAMLDLANQSLQVLTSGDLDEAPSVSPNGRMVLFSTRQDDRRILGEVSIDGRVHMKLPAPKGDVQEPAWSGFLS